MKCSKCKRVHYCSRDCQLSHWGQHKQECNKWKKAHDREESRLNRDIICTTKGNIPAEKQGAECSICLETVIDPVYPCAEQLAHSFCRECVATYEASGIHKRMICPLCRGPLRSEEDFHLKSCQKIAQANRATTQEAKGILHEEAFELVQEQLKIYPRDLRGQYNLGFYYHNGLGTEKNFSKALVWYRKAASQGFAMAQCNLGKMLDLGQGVDQSHDEAVKWYKKAAVLGNSNAQHSLGVCYNLGRGVKQDVSKAASWFKKSAAQGHALAQSDLAMFLFQGKGVKKDVHYAMEMFEHVIANTSGQR